MRCSVRYYLLYGRVMGAYMMCPYAEHGLCQIATRLANMPVRLDERACVACAKEPVRFAPNRVTAAIALYAKGTFDLYLTHLATNSLHLAGNTVERHIHKWLNRLRITPPTNCGCDGWVARMNQLGVEGSLENIDDIVNVMYENLLATYLSAVAVPFVTKPLIKRMVRKWLLSARS
jgi:hypothetical protein